MNTEKTQPQALKRSLQMRHINMIALGGALGTGLFLASGESLSVAGPGGALMMYALIGMMAYFIMTSLGEMATYLPVSGSFGHYATVYVDKAFGFAQYWNYWFEGAITLAAEMVAGGIIMQYWFPSTPAWIWSGIFLAFLFTLNFLSVKAYGEAEVFFASMKIITLGTFFILGTAFILGLGTPSPGFTNWTVGDAPFVGGIGAMLSISMIAGFAFQGIELIGVLAGEAENPEENVPKTIKKVFWRILIFYIGSFIILGFLLPYTDPNLLSTHGSEMAISPFILVLRKYNVPYVGNLINVVILLAILSVGNSGIYSSTRMLRSLAIEGKAPKVFTKVNKRGVPVPALLLTVAIGALAFLTSFVGDGKAYTWLINVSALSGFMAWVGIIVSHYRFRRAFKVQGKSEDVLKYKARWFPFGPIFAMVICFIVVFGKNYGILFGEMPDFGSFISSYIGLIMFVIVYLGYKIKHNTKLVPLAEINLSNDVESHVETAKK